jgi:hypothetical protein
MFDLGTATPLEITWSLLALIGLIVTLSNVGEAMRDLILGLTGIGGPLVPVVAWNNVRNEIVIALMLSGFLIIGLVAMTTPTNPDSGSDVGRTVVGAVLIGLELLTVINSFVNRRDRQVLKERIHVSSEPSL